MTERDRNTAFSLAYDAVDKLIDLRVWLDKDSDLYKEADSLKQQVEALKWKIKDTPADRMYDPQKDG